MLNPFVLPETERVKAAVVVEDISDGVAAFCPFLCRRNERRDAVNAWEKMLCRENLEIGLNLLLALFILVQ